MIYTAICGQKDPERTDIKVFGDYDRFATPRMNAKIYKVLSHLFIEDEISVWVDGNIYPQVPEKEIVEELLGDSDMALFRHPLRTNIYDEMEECKRLKLDDFKIMEEQIRDNPRVYGLYECGMIIRRHTSLVKRFNEAWWAEICRYSSRDQLSFPCILSKFPDIKTNIIEGNVRTHKFFKYVPHSI